jgi:hypothetical protein
VGEQDVEIAVAVQIGQLHAGRPPVRVGRGVQRLDPEARPRRVVVVRHDALVLLREQRDEIDAPVAIQIDRRHGDRARPRIDHLRLELRASPVGGLVDEHRDVPDLAPAERADDQVEIAVAVHVRGFGVCNSRKAIQLHHGVPPTRLPTEPRHAAPQVIAREQLTQVGDEQVFHAVTVQVYHFRMRRRRHVADHGQGVGRIVRATQHHETVASHVAHDELETAVAFEICEAHIGNGRPRTIQRDEFVLLEPRRSFARWRPRFWRRQLVWRLRFVVRRDCREVVGQHDPFEVGTRRLGPIVETQEHLAHGCRPAGLGQHVGRRQLMAPGTDRSPQLVAALDG